MRKWTNWGLWRSVEKMKGVTREIDAIYVYWSFPKILLIPSSVEADKHTRPETEWHDRPEM